MNPTSLLLLTLQGCLVNRNDADYDNDGFPVVSDNGQLIDCNDSDPRIHPGAEEVCDGIDNDCDGTIDQGDDVKGQRTLYKDFDGDGVGSTNLNEAIESCETINGYSSITGDCDDKNYDIQKMIWYYDDDGDGYGFGVGVEQCYQPDGRYTQSGNDCDDDDPLEHPGQTWYADKDQDGYVDMSDFQIACERPLGPNLSLWYAFPELLPGIQDCNDNDYRINPAILEDPTTMGIDDDCNPDTICPLEGHASFPVINLPPQYHRIWGGINFMKEESLYDVLPDRMGNFYGEGIEVLDTNGDGIKEICAAANGLSVWGAYVDSPANWALTGGLVCIESNAVSSVSNIDDIITPFLLGTSSGSDYHLYLGEPFHVPSLILDRDNDGVPEDDLNQDGVLDFDLGDAFIKHDLSITKGRFDSSSVNTQWIVGDGSYSLDVQSSTNSMAPYGVGGYDLGGFYLISKPVGLGAAHDTESLSSLALSTYSGQLFFRMTGDLITGLSLEAFSAHSEGGSSVILADLNGDGNDDIIAASPGYSDDSMFNFDFVSGYTSLSEIRQNGQGQVRIFPGSSNMGSVASTIIDGMNPADRYGETLISLGRFNTDLLEDFLVCAPNHDNGNGFCEVVYGANNSSLVSLQSTKIIGQSGDQLGASATVIDYNGDNYPDIAIGAPGTGKVYLVPGPINIGLSQLEASTLSSIVFGTGFGSSIAAGDFNGDGHDDLATGSPEFSGEGRVCGVYLDSQSLLLGTLMMGSLSHFCLSPTAQGSHFGSNITADDFNNDGKDDLLVGAPLDASVDVNSGALYVFEGGCREY